VEYLRGEEVIADILRHYERYRTQNADLRTRLLREAPGHT
jgi:choline/glycine/proline betaine transport protein